VSGLGLLPLYYYPVSDVLVKRSQYLCVFAVSKSLSTLSAYTKLYMYSTCCPTVDRMFYMSPDMSPQIGQNILYRTCIQKLNMYRCPLSATCRLHPESKIDFFRCIQKLNMFNFWIHVEWSACCLLCVESSTCRM